MTDARERLEEMLTYTNNSYNSFSKKIGLKRAQNLYDIRDGKIKNISFELASMIGNAYPEISGSWLLAGEGEMIKNINAVNDYRPNNDQEGIPMYNAPGASGGVEIYTDANSDKIIGYLNFPGVTKGSFALPVYGHSMYPTLENGVWVVLRPIMNKMSINWGQIYYIEYDDYRVFKRLLAGDNDDDVILWSDNQMEVINDRPKYAQVIIKKTEIRKLCLVTDVYKKSNN